MGKLGLEFELSGILMHLGIVCEGRTNSFE